MAENKQADEKKKSRKIKATTGAWWKSTVVEEEQQPREAQTKTDQAAEQQPAVTEQTDSTPKASRPSRKSPVKKSPAPETAVADAPTEATAAPVEPATGSANAEQPAAEKPRSSRTPRKRQPRASKANKSTAVVDQDAVVTETVSGEEAGQGQAEQVPQEKATKKPARSRRPRAARAAKPQETEATGESATTEPAAETIVEESAPPAKRPARKRSPRKKKEPAPTTAQGEGTEAAEALSVQVSEEEHAEKGQSESAAEPATVDEGQRKTRNKGRRGRKTTPRGTGDQVAEAGPSAEERIDDEEYGAEAQPELTAQKSQEVEEEAELPEDDDREKGVLKLLINAEEPEECRLALLEDGRLESINVSTINRAQTKNNIYKGRIVAIEPNLQAAFVDYGTVKNGFLPFSEIHPEYYKQELSEDIQKLVDSHHWKKLSITDVVEKGQDVLVQVVKEEVGQKGANMTTFLSLPGRSVVLMPGSDSSGISRKISGEERRSKLRTAMNSLEIPEGIGWIVRTAGVDITKSALNRDVGYLLRLWEEIKKKAQSMGGVGQVYEDHQSVLRFLREHFDPAIEEILVDDVEAMEQVKEFISLLPSKQRDVRVRLHKGSRPIFNQYSIEDQIESIYQPKVNLPSGGSIVIEPTEALVSIDVNSGSTSKGKNFDQSIYQANMEAAAELARQLRLRDLGGLIVVDFIDMRNKKHIRDVERQLKHAMRRDKAKVDFTRISKFGLMQISRQKLGSPIEAGNYRVCQHCKGRGTVRSVETLALFYLRRIQTGASRKHVRWVECHFPLDVAHYLLNNKRHEIQDHESRYNTEIVITANPSLSPVEHEITLHKTEKEENGQKQA